MFILYAMWASSSGFRKGAEDEVERTMHTSCTTYVWINSVHDVDDDDDDGEMTIKLSSAFYSDFIESEYLFVFLFSCFRSCSHSSYFIILSSRARKFLFLIFSVTVFVDTLSLSVRVVVVVARLVFGATRAHAIRHLIRRKPPCAH